jgi:hypothetical protein
MPPKFIAAPDGKRVPYPIGTKKPVDIFRVHTVGADAVIFSPESDFRSEFVNEAKMLYLAKRDVLKSIFPGKWFAISSSGSCLVTDTEDKVRKWANTCFPDMAVEDYYANCLGSEVSCVVQMDSVEKKGMRGGVHELDVRSMFVKGVDRDNEE